jgi:predicted glycosyltransferase
MKVWVDMTNSPHVPFFRPLIRLLEARGHEVVVSARDFAQTLELLAAAGIAHEVVGPPHGGAGRVGKARAMGSRLRALRAWARPHAFDLALSHASHELPLAARSLRVRSAYAYDYEFARAQHTLGSRAATRVVAPAAIPQERLDRLGAHAAKVRRYPGLKEEYYLSGFSPDRSVLDELGLDPPDTEPRRVLAVVRTPPEVSLYHRHGNPLFADVLERLGADPAVQAVVLPRTPAQRDALREAALPSLVLPERAVDAQSLIALADLVVSAGGTMNREAVALGTPVWTTFAGTMGAVDEGLIAGGRLAELTDADALLVAKKTTGSEVVRRDPELMLDLLLSALDG